MKKLSKYLKKRKTTIDFLLKIPENKYTPNTFHKLRVEIKKLNSLLDLIHFCSHDFKRRTTYKPFKSIFRQAGKVRELHIEDTLLQKYFEKKVIEDYRKNLKTLKSKVKKDFFLLLNKKLLIQLNKKHQEIITHLSGINSKKIKTYLEKKKTKIQGLLGDDRLQTKQIHELRKQLKILNYNHAIVLKKQEEERRSKQDLLPELLGKWHDCQVIIKHLKKALKRGQISPTEASQLKIIQSKIANESNILFNEIKKTIAVAGVFGGYN